MDIPSVLWLRSDGLIGIDGDRLSSWHDASGRQTHATQETLLNRPILHGGFRAEHGRNYVKFTSEFLGGPTIGTFLNLPDFCSAFATGEVFSVLRTDNDPSLMTPAGSSLWVFGSSGIPDDYPTTGGNVVSTFGMSGSGGVGANAAVNLENWHCLNIRRGADDLDVYINDALVYANPGTGAASFSTAPSIGGNSVANSYWSGSMAELIFFPRILSTAERAQVIQYLSDRFGLAIVAPVTPIEEWNPAWTDAQVIDARANFGFWTGQTAGVETQMADATDARSHRASIWF